MSVLYVMYLKVFKGKRHEMYVFLEVKKFRVFWIFLFMYVLQHCFICRPSNSTVSEDGGTEPKAVATVITARRFNQSAKSHQQKIKVSYLKMLCSLDPPQTYFTPLAARSDGSGLNHQGDEK